MQLMNIEWKWNIPNLLSLLRILLEESENTDEG